MTQEKLNSILARLEECEKEENTEYAVMLTKVEIREIQCGLILSAFKAEELNCSEEQKEKIRSVMRKFL